MTKELGKTEIFRSDFINNVSHEFKTPLSAIEGYATLLQNKSLGEEKRVLYATKIIYNTRRLSSLVGNVLELSKLENHKINIEKEEYSLDEQIREIILMFEGEWSQKKLELDIDLDSVDYFGNADLLGQVWQNLISNAIKFVGYSGKIHIRLRRKLKGIRVTVVDNGIGIDKENQERIFEKFYQEDISHSTSGNGLGLAIVKELTDKSNILLEYKSEEGKGSSFLLGINKAL